MTKTLRKAIIKRSKLKNKFNKERNAKNWFNYKQQQNLFTYMKLKIAIMENGKICNIFYPYFTNVTKGLKFRQVDKTQSIESINR